MKNSPPSRHFVMVERGALNFVLRVPEGWRAADELPVLDTLGALTGAMQQNRQLHLVLPSDWPEDMAVPDAWGDSAVAAGLAAPLVVHRGGRLDSSKLASETLLLMHWPPELQLQQGRADMLWPDVLEPLRRKGWEQTAMAPDVDLRHLPWIQWWALSFLPILSFFDWFRRIWHLGTYYGPHVVRVQRVRHTYSFAPQLMTGKSWVAPLSNSGWLVDGQAYAWLKPRHGVEFALRTWRDHAYWGIGLFWPPVLLVYYVVFALPWWNFGLGAPMSPQEAAMSGSVRTMVVGVISYTLYRPLPLVISLQAIQFVFALFAVLRGFQVSGAQAVWMLLTFSTAMTLFPLFWLWARYGWLAEAFARAAIYLVFVLLKVLTWPLYMWMPKTKWGNSKVAPLMSLVWWLWAEED